MYQVENKEDIMPCPFCGERDKLIICAKRNPSGTSSGNKNKIIFVKCQSCHAQGPRTYGNATSVLFKEKEAIQLWNHQTVRSDLKENEGVKIITPVPESNSAEDDKKKKDKSVMNKLRSLIRRFSEIINNPRKNNEEEKIKKKSDVAETEDEIKEENVPYTYQQLRLFKKAKVGDVLYARMPLSEDELSEIDEEHQERPYVVVGKTEDQIAAYQCTGNTYSWQKYYEYCLFSKDVYNNGKDSYIQLHQVLYLPIENLKFHYKTLYSATLEKLNKRIMISNYYGKKLPIFPNKQPYPEKGDLIQKDGNLYYVYSCYKKSVYAYKVYKDVGDAYLLGCYYRLKQDGRRYYIAFLECCELSAGDDYEFILIAKENRMRCVENAKEFYRKKQNEKKKKKNYIEKKQEYSLRYPIGQTFYLGVDEYLYLYHIKENMYVLKRSGMSYSLEPICIGETWLGRGECLDREKVISILTEVIKEGCDIHHILLEIIDEQI